jgi:hypothetical protein
VLSLLRCESTNTLPIGLMYLQCTCKGTLVPTASCCSLIDCATCRSGASC